MNIHTTLIIIIIIIIILFIIHRTMPLNQLLEPFSKNNKTIRVNLQKKIKLASILFELRKNPDIVLDKMNIKQLEELVAYLDDSYYKKKPLVSNQIYDKVKKVYTSKK
jgi:hypothetical protein